MGIQFHLLVVTLLTLTLHFACRYLCSFLYRCLLCPVGEGFEGGGTQPLSGGHNRVLWAHRHRGRRKATTSKPHSGTHPAPRPYPVESRHLAPSGDKSDFELPSGSGNPPARGSAIPHRGDRSTYVILSPSHNCGPSNSNPRLNSAPLSVIIDNIHANRFIECTISTIGILLCVSFPR